MPKLSPEQVARLDPFGVRKSQASEELARLLERTSGVERKEELGLLVSIGRLEGVDELTDELVKGFITSFGELSLARAGEMPERLGSVNLEETLREIDTKCKVISRVTQEMREILVGSRPDVGGERLKDLAVFGGLWVMALKGQVDEESKDMIDKAFPFMEDIEKQGGNTRAQRWSTLISMRFVENEIRNKGELVLTYSPDYSLLFAPEWGTHPEGIVVRKGKAILLNGKDLLYEYDGGPEYDGHHGQPLSWDVHPRGIVVRKDKQLLLNGKEVLYEGEWDRWHCHPRGVVVQRGKQLLLNGTKILYEGEFDDWRWAWNEDNVFVVRSGSSFLVNGRVEVYRGKPEDWEKRDWFGLPPWECFSGGLVIEEGYRLFWVSRKGKRAICNIRDTGFEDVRWRAAPKGAIVLRLTTRVDRPKNGEWIFYPYPVKE